MNKQDATRTVYQRKRMKNINILSILYSSIVIENNEKKIPKYLKVYNELKCGIEFSDQLGRKYSVKSSTNWLTHTFYNMLE